MAIHIVKPTRRTFFVARNANASIRHDGETSPDQVTSTGQPFLDQSDDPGTLLTSAGSYADQYPDLPEAGADLREGERYNYSGTVVQVRQSHIRTVHDPATVPALFLVARAPGGDIEWIAQEQVYVNDERTYNGTKYICIQAHVTEFTPDLVPALWNVVSSGTEWQAGVSYSIDDEVEYLGTTYICIQAHTSQVGWEPPNVPALWSEV